MTVSISLAVVIPAAGVGKRMQANCPKQYLTINDKTILEHTVERLLTYPAIKLIVIALGENDEYFPNTSLFNQPNIKTVIGGKERVDSVLAGLSILNAKEFPWVLVHDAARPCVTVKDIDKLVNNCLLHNIGGLLASPVSDTIKQANQALPLTVEKTIDRNALWQAYTPQMYPTIQLLTAIEQGLCSASVITDESSAIENLGLSSLLVQGQSNNIKITQPDDLLMAAFILEQQKKQEKICE